MASPSLHPDLELLVELRSEISSLKEQLSAVVAAEKDAQDTITVLLRLLNSRSIPKANHETTNTSSSKDAAAQSEIQRLKVELEQEKGKYLDLSLRFQSFKQGLLREHENRERAIDSEGQAQRTTAHNANDGSPTCPDDPVSCNKSFPDAQPSDHDQTTARVLELAFPGHTQGAFVEAPSTPAVELPAGDEVSAYDIALTFEEGKLNQQYSKRNRYKNAGELNTPPKDESGTTDQAEKPSPQVSGPAEERCFPYFFKLDHACFIPPYTTRNVYRTIVMSNLPPDTSEAELLTHVRGGRIISVRLAPMGKITQPKTASAMIQFLHADAAYAYAHFRSHFTLRLDGYKVRVTHISTPTWPLRRAMLIRLLYFQYTRCLKIQWRFGHCLRPRVILDQLQNGKTEGSHGCIRSENNSAVCYLEFSSVEAAIQAQLKLEKYHDSGMCRLSFHRDPCDAPLSTLKSSPMTEPLSSDLGTPLPAYFSERIDCWLRRQIPKVSFAFRKFAYVNVDKDTLVNLPTEFEYDDGLLHRQDHASKSNNDTDKQSSEDFIVMGDNLGSTGPSLTPDIGEKLPALIPKGSSKTSGRSSDTKGVIGRLCDRFDHSSRGSGLFPGNSGLDDQQRGDIVFSAWPTLSAHPKSSSDSMPYTARKNAVSPSGSRTPPFSSSAADYIAEAQQRRQTRCPPTSGPSTTGRQVISYADLDDHFNVPSAPSFSHGRDGINPATASPDTHGETISVVLGPDLIRKAWKSTPRSGSVGLARQRLSIHRFIRDSLPSSPLRDQYANALSDPDLMGPLVDVEGSDTCH